MVVDRVYKVLTVVFMIRITDYILFAMLYAVPARSTIINVYRINIVITFYEHWNRIYLI